MSEVNTGKVFSAEHKRNLKIAREKTSTVVSGKDCYGNETIYKSLCDAARAVNGYPTNISRATKSGKEYKGCFWEIVSKNTKGGDVGETLR